MERAKRDRARIRTLNDEMRISGPENAGSDHWLLTPGVVSFEPDEVVDIVRTVRTFDKFDTDNDPHGEHDFGSFEFGGEKIFWKIDYYNLSLDGGSPDPADNEVTTRVLTVMLALEY